MSDQDTMELRIGDADFLSWREYERACGYAQKFAREVEEPIDPVRRDIWRKERGLLRQYGSGIPSQDPEWIEKCFQQGFIGVDPATRWVMSAIKDCANVNTSVLICGDTGTGKEVVAECIHELGSRKEKPFVSVNCAAIPNDLLESELFQRPRVFLDTLEGPYGPERSVRDD